MIVESVTDIDKRRKKISLDNAYVFPLYNSEVRRYHIEAGQEISDLLLNNIEDEVLYPRAKDRALYILGSGDKTRKQMEDKLYSSFYPESIVSKVIEFLQLYGYIDDIRYIESYIRAKCRTKSRRQIESELLRKGLNITDIKNCFQDDNNESEEDAIMKLLAKNQYKSKLGDKVSEAKVVVALLRRGFQYEQITRCIDKYKHLEI